MHSELAFAPIPCIKGKLYVKLCIRGKGKNRSQQMYIKGYAKKDSKTKNLIRRLKQNDIAVINHENIDELAANQLIEKRVRAVINCSEFINGYYPNKGPKLLSEAGITLINNIGKERFLQIKENDLIEIESDTLYINKRQLGKIQFLTRESIDRLTNRGKQNLDKLLNDFIDNTLEYATKEKDYILGKLPIPKINLEIKGRHVLVVTRGSNYKSDLNAIKSYLREVRPVVIGVDGGADAILEFGYRPDIIVGDMDSVSDKSLRLCKEIIVHAYPDGTCPGLKRIHNLGLNAEKLSFPGTSEDIALLLAYESEADLIVTLGSHTSMIDFLEKGRKGMASTILVQMKVGSKIVNAKGVSELYQNRIKASHLIALFLAALFPITLVAKMSPLIQKIYQLIALKLRLIFGL